MARKPVFVFGSNEAGIHGAGAAVYALRHCGARWGVGEGLQGDSYAIPTKDQHLETLSLIEIEWYVERFLAYAHNHPQMTFQLTAIGCGLAGYKPEEIAPMFVNAPKNILLPERFKRVMPYG